MEGKDDACKCRARSKAQKKYQIIPDQVARLLNRREKQGEGEKGRKPLLSTSCIPAVGGGVSNVRRAYL